MHCRWPPHWPTKNDDFQKLCVLSSAFFAHAGQVGATRQACMLFVYNERFATSRGVADHNADQKQRHQHTIYIYIQIFLRLYRPLTHPISTFSEL